MVFQHWAFGSSQNKDPVFFAMQCRARVQISRDNTFRRVWGPGQWITQLKKTLSEHAGDPLEVVFELIVAKLFQEYHGRRTQTLGSLLQEAKQHWPRTLPHNKPACLSLPEVTRQTAWRLLEDKHLRSHPLAVVNAAFEHITPVGAKQHRGQYFTPAAVMQAAVKMVNPQPCEHLLDPACGSGGFVFHGWLRMLKNATDHPASFKQLLGSCTGWELDPQAIRLAHLVNHAVCNNQLEFYTMNSLNPHQNPQPHKHYDVIVANPPFAGTVRDIAMLKHYELGHTSDSVCAKQAARDMLFVERILQLLRPGGRAAIVLPTGLLNNASSQTFRKFVSRKARIVAVVDAPRALFLPHTSLHTSVLLLQRWNADSGDPFYHCPFQEDYPVFLGASRECGTTRQGAYLAMPDALGQVQTDVLGQTVCAHDWHNHEGLSACGLAEHFMAWARDHGVSFWNGC